MPRPKGFHHTPETKAKLSATRNANNPWPKGSKHSEEDREKMRQASNLPKGKDSPFWKGGKSISVYGYVFIYMPEHPKANCNYVLEHRIVMEKHLGRYLLDSEIVHHINHDKQDNRIENLMILSNHDHTVLHRHEEALAKK